MLDWRVVVLAGGGGTRRHCSRRGLGWDASGRVYGPQQ